MCLYTNTNTGQIASEEIKCYLVFYKKHVFNIYKTIRRKKFFRLKEGKILSSRYPIRVNLEKSINDGLYITGGLYSYVNYKPIDDKELIVWEGAIPKDSIYFFNNFEYVSDKIKLIKRLS